MQDYKAAASAGAKFLDEKHPNWFKQIDTNKLNMTLTNDCILGQLYGDYFEGAKQLALDVWPHVVGFNVQYDGTFSVRDFPKHYKLSTDAWKEEISQRLAKQV